MRIITEFIMKGRFQALIIAGILGGLSIKVVPVAIFSAFIIALFTLRKGETEGLFVLIGASIIIGVLSQFVETRPGMRIPVVLFLYIPVYISSSVLRKTQLQGYAVLYAAICAAVLAMSIQLLTGNAVEWWSEWLKLAISGVKGATFQGFKDDDTLRLINGFIAMTLGMSTVISVLLARWAQSNLYNPDGFKREFCFIQLPISALTGSIIVSVISYFISVNLMYDMLIIIAMMYFFQGLAVIHYIVEKKGHSKSFLVPPYLLFIFAPQYVIAGLAMGGILDSMINLRKIPKSPQL